MRGNSGDSAVLEYAGEKRKRENKDKKEANYLVDMEKNEGSKGENDRKADSCGETARTRITTKREEGEKERKRKEERREPDKA